MVKKKYWYIKLNVIFIKNLIKSWVSLKLSLFWTFSQLKWEVIFIIVVYIDAQAVLVERLDVIQDAIYELEKPTEFTK